MARHRKDLGARKHVRVELHKPEHLIPAPEAAWIECQILDVSDRGACLQVRERRCRIFGLAFTADGGRVTGVLASGAGANWSAPASCQQGTRQGLAFASADPEGRKAPAA